MATNKIKSKITLYFFIALGVLLIIIFQSQKQDSNERFEYAALELLKKTVTWDKTTIQSIMTKEGFSQLSDTQWDETLVELKKLGSVKKFGKPALEKITKFNAFIGKDSVEAIYLIPVEFNNKKTKFRLTMIENDDLIKLRGVRIID